MRKARNLDRNLVWDVGVVSIHKNGESLCGDQCLWERNEDGARIILSDGMGSGVKANILSTLTSTMLQTMLSGNIPLEECVSTVAATLPLRKDVQIAYATFTIASTRGRHVELVQYDNPPAIFIHNGVAQRYNYSVRFAQEKELHESCLTFEPGDMVVMFSDGVAEAGRGTTTYEGWPQADIEDFLARNSDPSLPAQRIAARMLSTVEALDLGELHDDTTIAILRLRERSVVNIMIGPPENKDDDLSTMRLFFAKEGKHVVCGGSTAKAVAKFLNQRVHVMPSSGDEPVPPMSEIRGVDLVTEGAVTLAALTELLKAYKTDPLLTLELERRTDGAAALATLLMEEATEINILFGNASNAAQDDTEFSFENKFRLMQELQETLKAAGKRVKISQC